MRQQKQLLPVREGELGLRQSDAVFAHVKQLGALVEALFEAGPPPLAGVGASVRPRDAEGSYMPCFLVGEAVAQSVAPPAARRSRGYPTSRDTSRRRFFPPAGST